MKPRASERSFSGNPHRGDRATEKGVNGSAEPEDPALLHLLTATVAGWRAEAALLRDRYGSESIARVCDAHAEELEQALKSLGGGVLTLNEGVRESGYSSAHLRALLKFGLLTNVGRRGAPRLLRSELPQKRQGKSTKGHRAGVAPGFDPQAAALSAIRHVRGCRTPDVQATDRIVTDEEDDEA